jgi:hypothetical protein
MEQLVRPNSVNILWQLPQLFVMTVGEILFSVTGLEFSYSQAAPSMKSVRFFDKNKKIIFSFTGFASSLATYCIFWQRC